MTHVHRRCRHRTASSLLEILLVLLLLTTSGLAIHSASLRNVEEAAWSAEKLLVEGLLRDLEEALRAQSYCDLRTAFPAEESGFTPAHAALLDEHPGLAVHTLLPEGADPADPQFKADPLLEEYLALTRRLQIERMVFVEHVADRQIQVTCSVRYRSRIGPRVRATRTFISMAEDFTEECPS